MTRWARLIGAGALVIAASRPLPGQGQEDPLASMADAERAFARAASTGGIRAAFLAYLDDEAIGFHPLFGRARDEWQSRPEPPDPLATTLEWDPRTGAVARDGRLGWLTGPYRLVPDRDASKTVYGCYFSVWRRAADAPWRVYIDLGISTPEPCAAPAAFTRGPGSERPATPLTREALIEADHSFAELSSTAGLEQGLSSLADPGVRIHRDGRQPIAGRDAALEAFKGDRAPWTFTMADAILATSGDLGVTYGRAVGPGHADAAAYVRVWRPDGQGRWRLAFDTLSR